MENVDAGTVVAVLAVVVFIGFIIWKLTHRNGSSGTGSGSGGGGGDTRTHRK